MKRWFFVLLLPGSMFSLRAQRILNDTVSKTAETKAASLVTGQAIDLDSYAGKKLVYIVLPAEPDTALTGQIGRFQKRFAEQVKVIGLVALRGKSATAVAGSYTGLSDSGVVLSEGIKQRREDSPQRTSVMEWITEKKEQGGELAAREEGMKYFISEDGRLYATLDATTSLDSPVAAGIVHARIPKSTIEESTTIKPAQHEK